MWEAILREWSLRWGGRVHGWWIDGCYFAKDMYEFDDEPNWRSFAAALKAGNAESLVAFNPGVSVPVIKHNPVEDYTAGEINYMLPVQLPRRYVNGAQCHILSFLGSNWGQRPPRFSDELAGSYTRWVNAHDGVVTWDVPIEPNGRIPEEFIAQLTAIGRTASAGSRAVRPD